MYLIYETQKQAQQDLDKIFSYIMQEVLENTDGTLYNIQTKQKEIPTDFLADKYPKLSRKNNILIKDGCYTTAYGLPQQDIHSNWYFRKPEFEFEHNGIEVETIEIQNTEI